MAQPKPKHRSRKRHTPRAAARIATIEHSEPPRSAREAATRPPQRAHPLKPYGDPPPSPFGGVPVSEIAIFAGAIAFVVGLIQRTAAPTVVGMVVCALGVLEFTVREHFSGYRSHSALLAAFPAVIIEGGLVLLIQPSHPSVILLPVIPIYAIAFVLLRRRFRTARQLRIARPPAP